MMAAPQHSRDPQHSRAIPEPTNGHDSGADLTTAPTRRPFARRSLMGELWVVAVAFAAVLLLLLVFILQNGQRADVSFLGAHGHLPMGVALLLAAVFGILLVAVPGTARIIQLRVLDRRRAASARPAGRPAPSGLAEPRSRER